MIQEYPVYMKKTSKVSLLERKVLTCCFIEEKTFLHVWKIQVRQTKPFVAAVSLLLLLSLLLWICDGWLFYLIFLFTALLVPAPIRAEVDKLNEDLVRQR